MAFSLPLSISLKAQGWKVKIRDRERVEPPHVTIIRGTQAWRWGLRERDFLDGSPPPRQVPAEVLRVITENYELLIQQWNAKYPENKVTNSETEA